MRGIIFLVMCIACMQLVNCQLSTGLKYGNCSQYVCISCSSTSAYSCYSCDSGYYLSGGYCYYCPSSCYSCTSSSWCTSCYSGYYLSNGYCSTRNDGMTFIIIGLLILATIVGIVFLVRYFVKKRQQNKQNAAFASDNPNYFAAPSQPAYGGYQYAQPQNNFYTPPSQPQYGYAAPAQHKTNPFED